MYSLTGTVYFEDKKKTNKMHKLILD